MHRQSLGSPVSKLHIHGCKNEDAHITDKDDPKRKDHSNSSSSSTSPIQDHADHELKSIKLRRLSLSPSHSKSEKLIHFIPLLTLLCLFVLYLVSHTPSQSDLINFNDLKLSVEHLDSSEIGDVKRFTGRSDVLALHSLRNLQEIGKQSPKSRSHRKIGDF